MIYKIKQFNFQVPFGAQYVGVKSKINGVYTVEYYADPEGKSPTYTIGHSNRVLTEEQFKELTLNEAGLITTPLRNRFYAVYVGQLSEQKTNPETFHYICQLIHNQNDELYRVGDEVGSSELQNPNKDVIHITHVLGKGRIDDYYNELEKIFGDNLDDAIENAIIEPLSDISSRLAKESADPLKKLKDTTRVKGQNVQKLRGKADKVKPKNKQIARDDYFDYGDDARGAMRAPYGPEGEENGEEAFIRQHGKIDFYDYSNSDGWGKSFQTVSNKDIGAKFEQLAVLDSGNQINEGFLDNIKRFIFELVKKLVPASQRKSVIARARSLASDPKFSEEVRSDAETKASLERLLKKRNRKNLDAAIEVTKRYQKYSSNVAESLLNESWEIVFYIALIAAIMVLFGTKSGSFKSRNPEDGRPEFEEQFNLMPQIKGYLYEYYKA